MARSISWRVLAVSAALLALSGARSAETPRPAKFDYTMNTLPNGLQVVYLEDHSTPVVHLAVWYHVGSKDEKAGRTGFAHLFEHLMFKGCKCTRICIVDDHGIRRIGAETDEPTIIGGSPARYLPPVVAGPGWPRST